MKLDECTNTIFRYYACFLRFYNRKYFVTYQELWEWYISDYIPDIVENLVARGLFGGKFEMIIEADKEPNEDRVTQKFGRLLTQEEFYNGLEKEGHNLINFAAFRYEFDESKCSWCWEHIPGQGFIRQPISWSVEDFEELVFKLKNPLESFQRGVEENIEFTTEKQVEIYLSKSCKILGWKCEKQNPRKLGRGVPDRKITTSNNKVIYVELKSPKRSGHLSMYQIEYQEKLRKQGYEVRVIWTKEQVDELIKELEKIA